MMSFQLLLSAVFIGCKNTIPESGIYTIERSNFQNTCGEFWGSPNAPGFPETGFNLDVDEQSSTVTVDEYWILDIQDNTTSLTEEYGEMTHPDNYTISVNQEWYFEWSSPKMASGYIGLFVLCDGNCPNSEPSIPADVLPCSVSWDYLLEKLE